MTHIHVPTQGHPTQGQAQIEPGLAVQRLAHFHTCTLMMESSVLAGNPLGDSPFRTHPVLVPKAPEPAEGFPVVFLLSGFTGNGPRSFNLKAFELSTPQVIDICTAQGRAPLAVYVFIDADTAWGGSQFINSIGTGLYEEFVAREIVSLVRANFPVSRDPARWCVSGGSSGGYGALHLASRHPDTFGLCAAVAPDSFFRASLLPDIWTALPVIEKLGGVAGVRNELREGRFMKRREAHTVLNAIAMGLCYAPGANGEPEWPVDTRTGILKPAVWQRWESHDPISFLKQRTENLRKLRRVFLDVGTRDQFHLQYGTRQIFDLMRETGVGIDASEFEGNHFDIGERREMIWGWLSDLWR